MKVQRKKSNYIQGSLFYRIKIQRFFEDIPGQLFFQIPCTKKILLECNSHTSNSSLRDWFEICSNFACFTCSYSTTVKQTPKNIQDFQWPNTLSLEFQALESLFSNSRPCKRYMNPVYPFPERSMKWSTTDKQFQLNTTLIAWRGLHICYKRGTSVMSCLYKRK